jgi:hypothetical protein
MGLGAQNGRRYERLFRTSAVEAWLIAWGSSTYLGLHDHGGSRAAYQVVGGSLTESSADLTTRSPLSTRKLGLGARRSLSEHHVHELWNPSAAMALSVHVYSPPLHTMSFYSDDSAHYLTKLRTESELEWPEADDSVASPTGSVSRPNLRSV